MVEAISERKHILCLFISMGVLLALFTACGVKVPPEDLTHQESSKLVSPPPVDVLANCAFAGWMGDGEIHGESSVTLDNAYTKSPHSTPDCVKITYRPGSARWAGVYAQFNVSGPGNWGEYPGRNLTGYTRLVWYARGQIGNEMVEFKAGGIDAPGKQYRDSFERSLGTIKLEKEWKRYEMDLSNEDLSSVIGGFCWIATALSNSNGLTFYIDSVTYE